MAVNNLRVIYQNLADLSTTSITASTTANATTTPASNLQKDAKSLIWRSTSTSATLTVAFASAQKVRGVVLPFTNLTATATINVTATVSAGSFVVGSSYTIASVGTTSFTAIGASANTVGVTFTATGTGSGTGTATYSTGNVLACPYKQVDSWDSSYLPQGANSYAYGSGTYARAWLPVTQTCASLTVTLNDTNNTAGYVEVSRLIVGDYWTPTYNTSFGLMSAPKSLSSTMRTESGDLVTNRGIQYNTMSFDLTWLTPADRLVFTKIIKSNGINKPLLISLFPDASEDFDKEQTFQIYGKLTQVPDLTHPMFSMYSSKVEIEEI